MSNILIIAEHRGGMIFPVTYELAAFARELSSSTGGGCITAVVVGDNTGDVADRLSAETGLSTISIRTPGADSYNSEIYKQALARLLKERNPSYICAAHTPAGLDFAPGLATRAGAACVSGVTGIRRHGGHVHFLRAAHGGKIIQEIESKAEKTVVTIQPGTFRYEPLEGMEPGAVETAVFGGATEKIKYERMKTAAAGGGSRLADARVVIAAGRGISGKKNLELIRRFSELFVKSSVAGSRPLIDAGWMEYSRQVGLTGAAVSPELYIACGISGSTQHVAGMRESKFIVAINSDPNAAIFNIADVCLVEDALPFLEEFIRTANR